MNGLLPALPSLLIGILHQNLNELQGTQPQWLPLNNKTLPRPHLPHQHCISPGLLRGQSRTVMTAHISPARVSFNESQITLISAC